MADEKYTGINRVFKSSTLQAILDKRRDGSIGEFLEDWKWIFGFSKNYRGIIVLYTILGLVSSSLAIVSAYVARILINIIVDKQYENLWILVATMLLSTVFSLVFGSVMSRVSTRISVHVNNDIQAKIFDQVMDAAWADLNRYPSGDLVNRFSNDVGTISSNAVNWIPNLIINIYTFVLSFVVMVRLDAVMALIAFFSAPVLLLLSRFILRKLRDYRRRVLELSSDMMSFEVETFSNMDMIKSFGITSHYSGKLRFWQKKYKDYTLDYNKFEIKANILLTLLSTLVTMIAFFYCLYRLWTGQILFGDMTFFLQQRSALTNRFNTLVKTFPGMINAAVSAHRVRELAQLPKEKHDEESLRKMEALSVDGLTVEMQGVTFRYDEADTVYEGSSFVARPGEIVAVLGPSGEGKTTLLRLLLGLVGADKGSIMLSGSDGQKVPMNADLRTLFSYVPQENSVLSGTIAENLRLVKPDATDEELIDALRTACAWNFVEKMPEKLDSTLGDNGRGISAGQAQRIAIARALLRDSPILLLDEATSALDMETEADVLRNIIKERPNKTCIVSTHRPGVLKQCQRIYRISDHGIHEISKDEI